MATVGLTRALPAGDKRTLTHSLVTGGAVTVGYLALTGMSVKAAQMNQLGPAVLASAVVFGASVAAINYTNHNGSFHDGKQYNAWYESALIGAGIGAVAGLIPMGNHGLNPIAAAVAGAGVGFVNGAILHLFNRPTGD